MVFSFQDKILLEGNVESNQLTFSANGWPSGIYFVRLIVENEIIIKKFVKT